MEIKLPGTEEREQQYYDNLLTRIREIQKSEMAPRRKIKELLSLSSDYDETDPTGVLSDAVSKMSRLDDYGVLRMFNFLSLQAVSFARHHHPMSVQDISNYIAQNVIDIATNPDIYTYTCYFGEYELDEDDNPISVSLPKELEDFKGRNMILKILDMDRLIDTFSSRDTYYRRAFPILAELDGRVLESLECNHFETWELVSYKDEGDAMFEFSHFEVNTNEPDDDFRTLYVVYRYDTTVS